MRKLFNQFTQLQTAGGILLGIATLIALFLANSPLESYYQNLLQLTLTLGNLHLSFLHFVNDGLMTIFFFLVSLEIKRELIQGELNSINKALLPTMAAIGGMIVPAFFYLLINHGHSVNTPGWAIPMATDIAFSLGVLSLLNKKIPNSLKIFLTALAIIDDLGAILVIAIFYTQQIGWLYLILAFACLIALIALNYFDINRFLPYLLFALPLWLFILKSGVHATIAGVLFGLTIPLRNSKQQPSLLNKLERQLHPWIAYAILPVFAFANAGLSFTGLHWKTLAHPLPLGIIAGLFLGKQLGILSASWLAVKAKWAKLPHKANWQHIYGTALICGIGFTMSLFIANLAFSDGETSSLVRLGVLSGSALSGILGYFVLFFSKTKSKMENSAQATILS
ncbi:Na+/H+ antiporter NhaA [Rickettsiella endosymbiont of Dermanyssus gallinae]|uniref:Na+/H+ antiporter NhaA n=1 Tax=Rickettsiella endosymbiont of Dermanyssus gallinae TaxID=2856608 RepID=UPI001C52B2B2|nr:Na+/H+ antiporter NhaA [Rickettsiella endosymbiont of Dermanyssus gallinae]